MKNLLSILLLILTVITVAAQDQETPAEAPFEAEILVDNQTVVTPYKGGLEYNIQHRFGTIKNGITDIFGIYAPSNIRMGFNYGLTEKLMIGVGSTKDYKLQDVSWKYAILQQTESGSMPVSVSYYGNTVIDARAKEALGPEEQFREAHRFSYATQIIVAHRFNEKFSLQVAPGFLYLNAVEQGLKNANFSINAGARAKIIGYNSLVVEYNQLLTKQENSDMQPKPGLSFGYEIGTGTHAFQIFLANYSGLVNQRNLLYNTNDFTKGEFVLGFNITVRF